MTVDVHCNTDLAMDEKLEAPFNLSLLIQPVTFFLFRHRAFLDSLGKTLFFRALLLAACRAASLAPVQRHGRLAIVQHAAELLHSNLKEVCEACQLRLAQAHQFDGAGFKFFPYIDTKPQPSGRAHHRQTPLRAQLLKVGRHRLPIKNPL